MKLESGVAQGERIATGRQSPRECCGGIKLTSKSVKAADEKSFTRITIYNKQYQIPRNNKDRPHYTFCILSAGPSYHIGAQD